MCDCAACARPAMMPAVSVAQRVRAPRIDRFFMASSVSVRPGELDSGLDFGDGVVHQTNRFGPVTAFVRNGCFELLTCRAQLVERRVHVRLSRAARASDQVTADDGEDEEKNEEKGTASHESSFSGRIPLY